MAERQDYAEGLGETTPVVLLNGPVCTSTGLFRVSELQVEEARRLVRLHGWVSAVGHEATAALLSRILDIEVPRNRVEYEQRPGQLAIALKLNQRAPEGQILSEDEMLRIGFSLLLLERIE